MVEILVAFMVVMLLIVLFTKVITVSGSILMKSHGKIEETQTFNENYYKVSSQNARDKDRYQSLEFNLEIDTEETDDKKIKRIWSACRWSLRCCRFMKMRKQVSRCIHLRPKKNRLWESDHETGKTEMEIEAEK